MADPAELLPGTVFAGRYRIERRVDVQAGHDVYAATHQDGRRIALKLMRGADRSADARRRFLQEANDAATLEGTRVTEVAETGEDPARGPFIAMVWPAAPGATGERAPASFLSTVAMPPSSPVPSSSEGEGFLRTVAMSPDGSPPDEVKLARARVEEAARVEAMMKAPRVHATTPPKKPRNGFLIATVVLVVLAVGASAFWMARRSAPPPPVKLPAPASSTK